VSPDKPRWSNSKGYFTHTVGLLFKRLQNADRPAVWWSIMGAGVTEWSLNIKAIIVWKMALSQCAGTVQMREESEKVR